VLARLLEMLLPTRPGEQRLTFALLLHNLFAVGAFLTGRTVRDALFLTHGDKDALAWMYVASAVAVTLTGLLYTPLASRVRRDRVTLVTASIFSGLFVLAWFAEQSRADWVYPAIYVYVEVMGAIVLVQFWTLANELFNAREAKRLYGFIGAGGTLANIFVGLLGARVALVFGTNSLLLLVALLLVGTAAASFAASRFGRQRLFARAATGKPNLAARRVGGASRVLGNGHLRTVALLAAVTFFTTTLIDFQFKVIAAREIPSNELAAYFSYFSVAVGLLALCMQLFGTSKLLNRAGVIGSLALLPASLAMGDLALIIFPTLWAASLAKGSDTLFRYSVNDATTQILYLPVPAQARASAKAFVDGVVKPLAIGLSGLALAGYRVFLGGDPYRLAFASVIFTGAWLVVVNALRSHYIRTLAENLKNRRLDLESARHKVLDGNTNQVLLRALESLEPREVLNALALLPHLDNVQLDSRVEALLDHREPQVRTAACEYYARRQTMRFANSVYKRFEDPDPGVRAAAVDAFCAIGRDKAVRSVRGFLNDADPRIRSAAVIGMIRYGGLDGVLVAAEALKMLIEHPDPVMREHAARVLGAIGVKNFYQPVLGLMNDPDARVRRAAINAAGVLRSPEFVIPLIYRTQSIETLHEAVDALTLFGNAIIPTLAKVLGNHLEDPHIRRAVARVLGRLATTESVNVITHHLGEPDEELRARMYKSLARAVRGRRMALSDPKPVNDALMRELERAFETLHQAELLGLGNGPGPDTPLRGEPAARALLASALAEKVAQAERRIFLLLAVLYPDADMEQIYAGIHDATALDAPRRRANATELLDNLLARNVKRRFLPLLEELPRAKKLELVAEMYAPRPRDARAVLTELARDETAWVRACAVWCLSQLEPTQGAADLAELLASSTADQNPVVRESALVALSRAAPMRAREIAESRLRDEAPVVRRQAAIITTTMLQHEGAVH
jgi:ATP/ADP translocase/HEAT repeat protein